MMRGSLAARAERHPALPRILPFALLLTGIAVDALCQHLPEGVASSVPGAWKMGGWAIGGWDTGGWDLRWNYGLRNLAALCAILWLRQGLPELALATTDRRTDTGLRATDGWLALILGLATFVMWVHPALRAFSQAAGGIDLGALRDGTRVLTGSGFTPFNSAGQMDWGLAACRLAGSALVVPVAEELFWRSYVMRSIEGADFGAQDPRRLGRRAWCLQALCFGAEHDLWLAGILAGLAYGWLYRSTGRLWPAILAHAITNAVLGVWVLRSGAWGYW